MDQKSDLLHFLLAQHMVLHGSALLHVAVVGIHGGL